MSDYLIIGAGAAGISAVEAIRSLDSIGEVTQVCDEQAGYYSRPGLAYLLTGEIAEDCLYPFQKADFNRLNVHTIHARVKRILPAEHQVELENGKYLPYRKLLIAVGAHASEAKVPGANLDGVVKLDNLEDAHCILRYARKRRTAVVVGGGITALELVEGFRARGVKVHYFLRGERYWSNVLDETESHIVEKRLVDEGIEIHYQTELAEIQGKHGKVTGVLTTGNQQVRCDIAGIAIGIQPRKGIAETAGLKTDRGISVDEYLCTSEADIFAAGDVAQVYDPSVGKAILDSLWMPARRQGYTAGLNMVGKKIAYYKGLPFNVTRLAGLTTTIIGALGGHEQDADVVGIVRGESEGWRQMPDAIAAQAHFEVNRLRVLVGEHYLLGGLLMGDQTLSHAIHHLVAEKVDITPIRDKILNPNRSITDVIGEYWIEVVANRRSEHATIQS